MRFHDTTISRAGDTLEAGYGLEPELWGIDPANIDYCEPDPLTAWLETDGLTLVTRPHIDANGSVSAMKLYTYE